jgi:hypothetical protein
MEDIKITIEKNGELSVLHLKSDKSLFDIINAIGKITKEDEDIETFIEKQLLLDGKDEYIYDSPDGGSTIYKRRIGEKKKELITNGKSKTETRHDMGGSYEISVKEKVQRPMSEWYCSYCGDHTYEVDSDYLLGVDHLSCLLKNDTETKEKG